MADVINEETLKDVDINDAFREAAETFDDVEVTNLDPLGSLSDKYSNVIGAAAGAGIAVGGYLLVTKVGVPGAKKAVKKIGDIVHDIRFPKPDDVEADYREVEDEDEESEEESSNEEKSDKKETDSKKK